MATLPTYQRRGVQFANLPEISIAPQRAAIQGASALDQALNRMTSYFEKQAVTEAQTMAYKYAAENQLTEEQVRQQLKEKGKVTVDGAGRIFQQTYEKTQAALLGNQVLLEQEAEIGAQAARIEAGAPVDLNTIQKDLKARRDGVAALLMQLDPEAAVKFSQGLAKAGNTLLKVAAKKQAETQMAIAKTKLQTAVTGAIAMLEQELEQQVGITPPPTPEQILNNEQPKPFGGMEFIIEQGARIEVQATVLNSPQVYEDYLAAGRKAMQSVVVKRLTVRGGAKDASEALAMLDANNLGNLSNMYKAELSQEEKDSVRVNVLKYFADKHTASERQRAELERAQEREAIEWRDKHERGEIGPSELASNLIRLNQATPTDLERLRSGDVRPASPVVYDRLLFAAEANQLGTANVEALYENGTINSKQRNDLRKEITNQGTEMSSAKQFISGQLGIPEGLDIAGSYQEQRRVAASAKAELISRQDEAMRKGLPFDPMTVARELVAKAKVEPGMKVIDEARARLQALFKSRGIEYQENYTRDDLSKRLRTKGDLDSAMADLAIVRGSSK